MCEIYDMDLLGAEGGKGSNDFRNLLGELASWDKNKSRRRFSILLTLLSLQQTVILSTGDFSTLLRRSINSNTGRRYAAVLPDPVLALASRNQQLIRRRIMSAYLGYLCRPMQVVWPWTVPM